VTVGDTVWTECQAPAATAPAHLMRGVIIFRVAAGKAVSARFYLEPVEETSGGVDAQIARVAPVAAQHGARP